MTEYPPISSYIAAARAGEDVEAPPDPGESAREALLAVPWLREPDVTAILGTLDEAGLTICWRP